VRRAWLWGADDFSGKDYSHRKQWVVERLQRLTNIFTIDICAYAVMSHHYHLVLHVDKKRATTLTEQDVIARWKQWFGLPMLVEHDHKGLTTTKAEANRAKEIIALWRSRLYDISWFMRCLNEHLARVANKEDNGKGRFWEGRYKSQALLDEAGLLTAMAYVDLNPIRAGIAKTPEASAAYRVRSLFVAFHPTRGETPAMARPLRIEFPGALHAVIGEGQWAGP
jgi:REP element-mobilizing transposase RayT